MAEGALHRSPADVAVAVTGVAGPDPDEDGNPVGLVCIAVARDGREPLHIERQQPSRFRTIQICPKDLPFARW
jgi:nicotinamide-nucleotide amidase